MNQAATMEVTINSEVWLKPSSPTPPHLKNLNLSILDQLIPAPYGPITFFYKHITNHMEDSTHTLRLLKDSLSKILHVFYPLAGCVIDEFTIDCSDGGFRCLEAQVNCDMDDYLNHPDLLAVHKLLPVGVEKMYGTHVGNVQINLFKCGGIAISLCVSHKILDGAGISIFMNAWAAAARGDFDAIFVPNFNSALVFPVANPVFKEVSIKYFGSMFRPGNFVTKIFLFDSASIVKLKDEIFASFEPGKRPPTRVEAVSSMLWKAFIKGSRMQEVDNNVASKPSVLTHVVNLRRRLNENLLVTEQTLCNLIWIASATISAHTEPELSNLANEVRQSIENIDSDLIIKLRSKRPPKPTVTEQDSNMLGFSSWCKMGLYEVDFGWGKPVWISSIGVKASIFANLVLLVDTRDGEGIEAWVTVDESIMNLLAEDSELGRFACMDLSPLSSESSKLH